MAKYEVLIVDDEWNMRNLLKIYLTQAHCRVIEAQNGNEALALMHKYNQTIHLVILDIMMPDMDGWEVCKEIRKHFSLPILMLTARTDVKDVVRGLNEGADDYLTKPFAPEELLARVNALLRRTHTEGKHEQRLLFKDLIIDRASWTVYVNDQNVHLTPKEFELLLLLATHPNRVFTRDVLLNRVWGPEQFRDDRTVDTHVKNIREKIRKKGLSYDPIQTIWGVGYQFEQVEVDRHE